MKPEDLRRQIENSNPRERKNAWASLCEKPAKFPSDHSDIEYLRNSLKNEDDLDVRSYGIICLQQFIEWTHSRPATTLQDWLFKPFMPRPLSAASIESAVIAVCDEQHIRDVHPLIMLARFLPADRFHATGFHQVSLRDPSWEAVALDKLNAVCFVGRPSMFRNCKLVDAFPPNLRFILPKEDELFRGKELSNESIESYHHVCQKRPNAGPILYRAAEKGNQRTDYAVVQRFRVDYGGRPVTVLIIAGGTSLGTVGAAEWVTTRRLDDYTCRDVARLAGMEIDDSDRVEVLLDVTGEVHTPAQPWRPHCLAKKMFLNNSPNLLCRGPQTITLGMDSEDPSTVRYVLFDDDEVKFTGDEHASLVALCLKCRREGKNEVSINDLLQDSSVWPNGRCGLQPRTAVGFFRDHIKKYRLRDRLSVITKPLILRVGSEIHIRLL